jgi:hypothetical protein
MYITFKILTLKLSYAPALRLIYVTYVCCDFGEVWKMFFFRVSRTGIPLAIPIVTYIHTYIYTSTERAPRVQCMHLYVNALRAFSIFVL